MSRVERLGIGHRMMRLHQYKRHRLYRGVIAAIGLNHFRPVQLTAFEQKARGNDGRELDEIAVREHLDHVVDLVELTGRIAKIPQALGDRRRVEYCDGTLYPAQKVLAGGNIGGTLHNRLERLPPGRKECLVVGIGHGHHPHPGHLEGPLVGFIHAPQFALRLVLPDRANNRDRVRLNAIRNHSVLPSANIASEP